MMRALMQGSAIAAFTVFAHDTIPDGWTAPAGFSLFEGSLPNGVSVGWTCAEETWAAPVVQASDPEPKRVSKADFQRLLEPSERYAINALRRQIAGLSPADYADTTNSLLVAAEDVLFAFEQPLEFIELDHADTYAGLMLLSYLDVLTESRVTEIIGG